MIGMEMCDEHILWAQLQVFTLANIEQDEAVDQNTRVGLYPGLGATATPLVDQSPNRRTSKRCEDLCQARGSSRALVLMVEGRLCGRR